MNEPSNDLPDNDFVHRMWTDWENENMLPGKEDDDSNHDGDADSD